MGSDTRVSRSRTPLRTRGEGLVALAGVSLGGLLVLVSAAWAWWGIDVQRQSMDHARRQEVNAAADFVATCAAERLREGGEQSLASLQAFVKKQAQEHELNVCRVTLANGLVVADSDPLAKVTGNIPEKWTDAPARTVAAQESRGDVAAAVVPFVAGKRGAATLEVEAPIHRTLAGSSPMLMTAGLIGAGSIMGLWFAISRLRRRMAAIEHVRTALLRAAAGERDITLLQVDGMLGAEASGWNAVLERKREADAADVARRAQEALRAPVQREGDLHSTFDALSQGVILLDENGRIRQANGAAGILLSTRKEAMLGVELSTVVTHAEVVAAAKEVAAGTSRQRRVVEVASKGDGGPGVLRFSIRPVRKDDKATAIVVIEDVTQQKAADEARLAFVAQATHELRTPLTNMRLYAEQLLDDETDAAARATALNVINQEIRRLERIISDMLSVAEIESGSLQVRSGEVRMDALLAELEKDFAAQALEKEITLDFSLSPKIPVLRGDRDKVAVALHNLIGNALKYTPAGGTVTVKADTKDDRFVIDIADNGIGIAPEEADMVFEKFYRARDKRLHSITGTGLGLTLAREIARLHGGDVTLKSQLDKGSTFTLTLPAGKAA